MRQSVAQAAAGTWLLLLPLLAMCHRGPSVRAPETFVPNLLGVYRADAVTGTPPTGLTDRSPAGHDLAGAGGTIVTRDGRSWLQVAGAGSYTAVAASPWKPLHDGTGMTIWAVVRPRAHGDQDLLLDTGVYSSAFVGCGIWQDTAKERLAISVCNGDGVAPVLSEYTWTGSWANNVDHVLVVSFATSERSNFHLWIDGQLAAQFSLGVNSRNGVGPPLSGAAPHFPLRLFALNPGGDPMYGQLAEIGFSASVVSSHHRRAIEDWAAATYPGVRLSRAARPQLLFDGNSLLAFNTGIVRTVNPENVPADVRLPVCPAKAAVYGLRTGEMVARAATHVTPRYDASRPSNILVAWELINSLASHEDGPRERVYELYVRYCRARQAEGWKVVAVTACPCAGIARSDQEWINAQLMAHWPTFAAALATPHLDPIVGSWDVLAADAAARRYRSDGTHWTDLGNRCVEPWFVAAIDTLLPGRVSGRVTPATRPSMP